MSSWITCRVCDEEYKVVTGIACDEKPKWCPFCGSEVEPPEDDEDSVELGEPEE